MKTQEAKKTLKDLLRKAGFDSKKPELKLILNVFKEFAAIDVDCSNDAFLFQCGVYNFTGEDLFYWDLVRQFEVEDDGEYDHMEQLHLEIKFMPNDELNGFNFNKWSFDFDIDEYFKYIESLKEFSVPIVKYIPKSIEIYQEEV